MPSSVARTKMLPVSGLGYPQIGYNPIHAFRKVFTSTAAFSSHPTVMSLARSSIEVPSMQTTVGAAQYTLIPHGMHGTCKLKPALGHTSAAAVAGTWGFLRAYGVDWVKESDEVLLTYLFDIGLRAGNAAVPTSSLLRDMVDASPIDTFCWADKCAIVADATRNDSLVTVGEVDDGSLEVEFDGGSFSNILLFGRVGAAPSPETGNAASCITALYTEL